MWIWQRRCPIFIAKIQQSFMFGALWLTGRVSCLCIRLTLGQARAPQSIKHIDACRIHWETNITWWHGLGWSHRDDCAHNIAWICTYSNCLGHMPTLQGQEHSWLERVAHVATRVHHTKYTITHKQAYIDIHTSRTMLSLGAWKWNRHCRHPKGMAQ